jgi:thioredoxin reductase (NADPH)
MMQEIERSYNDQVKLNVLDQYKGKSLCDRLACDVEPMTIFYTKNGEVVEVSNKVGKTEIMSSLNKLVDTPIEV